CMASARPIPLEAPVINIRRPTNSRLIETPTHKRILTTAYTDKTDGKEEERVHAAFLTTYFPESLFIQSKLHRWISYPFYPCHPWLKKRLQPADFTVSLACVLTLTSPRSSLAISWFNTSSSRFRARATVAPSIPR